jgi:hypothetical protein
MRALVVTAARNGGASGARGARDCHGIPILSFLPTDYRGVSELGEIASSGMIIALIAGLMTVVDAFIKAAIYALISIAILLWLFLRRLSDVAVTLFPLILAAIVTLEICAATGIRLNFANIIALPVLLGVGVAFKIYYIIAWRQRQIHLLASPLTARSFTAVCRTFSSRGQFGSSYASMPTVTRYRLGSSCRTERLAHGLASLPGGQIGENVMCLGLV